MKLARGNLEDTQSNTINPFDEELRNEEKLRSREFKRLSWAGNSLANQISKVHWLKEGDQNTKYFFKCVIKG